MAISVGSNPYSSASTAAAYSPQTASTATASTADDSSNDAASTGGGSDTVSLSDAAKAYLASLSADAKTRATDARTWFDQQYKANGISSAMLDGNVAIDMTSQSRATLSTIASNGQSLFSQDEVTAAALTLQKRFDDAMTPHVVIARHTGDYASLYKAASDYLDQAGPDEQATPLWISTKKAVTDGLALAQITPMKAPDTTDPNDPVRALLDKTSHSDATAASDDDTSVATAARAKLDAQVNSARDAGTNLVFDPARKTGQLVDFTGFDNQSLAVVALNQDNQFSTDEIRAAKKELDQRNRTSILSLLNGQNGGTDTKSQSLALLSHYNGMSAAEKTAMGYTDSLQNRLIQNYRAASMFSGSSGSASVAGGTSSSLLAYL